MKTVKDYLEALPEPQKTEALNEVHNQSDMPKAILEKRVESKNSALVAAFSWVNSEQGYDYWANVVTGKVVDNC